MEIVASLTFSGETVPLDEKHFIDCTLEGCSLVYLGGGVIFERTRIISCKYKFGDHARRTVELLKVVGLLTGLFPADDDLAQPVN